MNQACTSDVSRPASDQRRTVLVLGAAGRLGKACVQAFAAAGWHVLAQQRRTTALPPGVEALQIPLHHTAQLAAAAAQAQTVLYAVNPLYTRWDQELLPLFRQGVAVARQLRAHFLLPGNVYNYGRRMPALLSEHSPQLPDTRKGMQRVLMEDELAREARHGLDSVVLRAGDFFGSGQGSWLDQLVVKDIARGRVVYPGPHDVEHAWAYLPDLSRAFVAVAEAARPRGLLKLHFSGHSLTGGAFIQALQLAAAAQGLAPAAGLQVRGLPWGLIRAVGVLHPQWRELARMSYLWRVPHRLSGEALEQHVGALHSTPITLALQAALRDLGLGGQAVVHPASSTPMRHSQESCT